MPVGLIKFNNIKLKYYLNEDILLEYALNAEVSCIYQSIQLSCNYHYRISDIQMHHLVMHRVGLFQIRLLVIYMM
jgi:hypothetical protein